MSLFPADVLSQAAAILDLCRSRSLTLATAESCTGGLIAACFTEIAGASDVFECGFVTYSNRAKQEMLGVDPLTLERFGAVSQETAVEMAQGAVARSNAQIAISVTGIAGPGGGSMEKPVGLVWLAAAARSGQVIKLELRLGGAGRSNVRQKSLKACLALTSELLDSLG